MVCDSDKESQNGTEFQSQTRHEKKGLGSPQSITGQHQNKNVLIC